ncbi:hypothetical protein EUA06_07895 [Nocardioides glacieisoli]|uniref:WD40 repeat domain-containing protein n=1 Tax=Nocardioides glacieisoli TaxID=1168730 RepID=A0A4Q2RRR7_9ACTN|nr:PD40 domain-containing protein [Nocardioides glacieisoli]RYB91246.1 hypothetical protein EUA06_07895 [Nocardioides glacieisoli]
MRMAAGVPLVLGLCASGLAFTLGSEHDRQAPEAGTYALPEELAGYSYVTGSVSSSPPGPAVALFQHGFGVEFMDFPQAVVLGAGGDSYRRVDVAEDRAGAETQGDPAPMLLSPDGQYVAVGDHDTTEPDVAIVDLTTGETSTYDLPQGRSVIPVAFSADGGSLAMLLSAEPTNPYRGVRITGDVGVLDLADSSTEVIDVGGTGATAAFSPDGSEIGVERASPRELSLIALGGGGSERRLSLDGVLAGPTAWSPDGRLLAITTVEPALGPPGADEPGVPSGLAFVDPTGDGGDVPEPLPLPLTGPGRVLGWDGTEAVLVLLAVEDDDAYTVSRVPLDGSEPTTLMRMDDMGSYGVGRFQLAAAAGDRLEVVDPDDVGRGPWPLLQRISAAVLAGLVMWLVAAAVVRIGRRVTLRA